MNSSATPWQSETGREDTNLSDEFDIMDCLDEELVSVLREELQMSCLFPTDDSSPPSSSIINIESSNSIIPPSSFCPSSSSPVLLTFGNPNFLGCGDLAAPPEKIPKRAKITREPLHAYDHNVAERKRREQLSRHFVALSAILPGLKKMDKLSILGDAIKHMKHLQARVESLEEEATKKSTESHAVLVDKFLVNRGENESSDEPKIEARVCNTQILIKIQCEYRKGVLANLIVQLEKLNLTILSSYAAQFGMLAFEITFHVQMEKEFNLSVNEVVKSLHAAMEQDV